ncbi:hypothetical protein O3P69_014356 [Scylla paramamosain]|uniref:Uncharacterized protein n=1 Tax=Scylla paramamosain TaxID=85552 RepID=A0AAW0TC45_SCYPA
MLSSFRPMAHSEQTGGTTGRVTLTQRPSHTHSHTADKQFTGPYSTYYLHAHILTPSAYVHCAHAHTPPVSLNWRAQEGSSRPCQETLRRTVSVGT